MTVSFLRPHKLQQKLLTVRFMKLRNFLSISVIIEKSPSGRYSRTVVTLIWGKRPEKHGSGSREQESAPCTGLLALAHVLFQTSTRSLNSLVNVPCTFLPSEICQCVCPFPAPSHPQKGKTGKGYNETLVSIFTFVIVQRKMPEVTKCTANGLGVGAMSRRPGGSWKCP